MFVGAGGGGGLLWSWCQLSSPSVRCKEQSPTFWLRHRIWHIRMGGTDSHTKVYDGKFPKDSVVLTSGWPLGTTIEDLLGAQCYLVSSTLYLAAHGGMPHVFSTMPMPRWLELGGGTHWRLTTQCPYSAHLAPTKACCFASSFGAGFQAPPEVASWLCTTLPLVLCACLSSCVALTSTWSTAIGTSP